MALLWELQVQTLKPGCLQGSMVVWLACEKHTEWPAIVSSHPSTQQLEQELKAGMSQLH